VGVPLVDPFPPAGEDGDGSCVIWDDSFEGHNKWAATVIPIEGSAGSVLDGLPMECRFISGESSAQCPNNDCGSPSVWEKHNGRTGRFVGYALGSSFQAFADGGTGFMPPGAVYDGGGQWHIPGGDEGGGLRFNHAPQHSGLSAEVTKLVRDTLSGRDCIDFYTTVFNRVSTEKNPVLEGGDLSKIFQAFLNQPKPHELLSRNMPANSDGHGNPIGNIRASTAAIFAQGNGATAASDAATVISELFHLAGTRRFYSDQDLASAARQSKYAADAARYISSETNIFHPDYAPVHLYAQNPELAYSAYFHYLQVNICNVSPGTLKQIGNGPWAN
jgi:hypothetical protein